MPWVDPIVEEVRRVREAYAAKFNYDLEAIFADIKKKEQQSGREFVNLEKPIPRKRKRKPNTKAKS